MKTFMTIFVLALISTTFVGCDLMADLLIKDEDWTVSTDGLNTKEDVFVKTAQIQYDYSDKWPTPPTVENTMRGDCKGYSILAIQMLYQMGHKDVKFIVARETQGSLVFDHALISLDDMVYEPQNPEGYVSATNIEIIAEWSYERLRHEVRLQRLQGRSVGGNQEESALAQYNFVRYPTGGAK